MSSRKSIFDEALGLPLNQRARLAKELLRSLEDEPEEDPRVVEREWTKEIERRVREIDEGKAKLHSWESVRKDVRAAVRGARRGRRRSSR